MQFGLLVVNDIKWKVLEMKFISFKLDTVLKGILILSHLGHESSLYSAKPHSTGYPSVTRSLAGVSIDYHSIAGLMSRSLIFY